MSILACAPIKRAMKYLHPPPFVLALIFALLVMQRVFRRALIGKAFVIGGLQGLDFQPRGGQLGFLLAHGDLELAVIQLEKHGSRLDRLIVMDIDLAQTRRDVGTDLNLGDLHIGIVGRDIPPAVKVNDEDDEQGDRRTGNQQCFAMLPDPASR